MRLIGLLVVWILGAFSAPATAVTANWQGVWSGTIGNAPIMLCIQQREFGDSAAYYYRKHLAIITLSPDDEIPKGDSRIFFEGYSNAKKDEAARLSLSLVNDKQMIGTWQKSKAAKGAGLKILLSRVAVAADDDNACSSLAFNTPRATPIKITRKPAKFDGVNYTILTADVGKHFEVAIDSFELEPRTAAVKKINAELRSEIPVDPLKSNYFQCVTGALSNSGLDGDYGAWFTPTLISRSYLVSQESIGDYCGGAHPNYSISWRNWDLRTGNEIRLWDWFDPSAISQEKQSDYTQITINAPLRRILTKKWKDQNTEKECDFVGEESDYWDLHLTRKGMSFYPNLAHAIKACADDIDFSFADLTPLLSLTGKRALADFRADLAKK